METLPRDFFLNVLFLENLSSSEEKIEVKIMLDLA